MNFEKEDRENVVIIDVTTVKNSAQLHLLLKKHLGFPDFYGMNWDAFWDAITGLVEMPHKLILVGWEYVEHCISQDAAIMRELLQQLNVKHPTWGCDVEYRSFIKDDIGNG
ncbi:barstar family protein [Paenibacillus xylanexedens]|uniref:barstar family protein n=1 Tax=Paenibacillus xylanexedens TaxID=528191 RepID=UPI0011A73553|nr:barstar family protein [Paenibacillus xylanexedens]